MKQKRPRKKLDPYRRVEEKLKEFSERICKIEDKISEIEEKTRESFQDYLRYIEFTSQNIYFDILIQDELSRLDKLASGTVSLFDNVINNIQKKNKIHNQIRALRIGVVTLPFYSQTRVLLELSKKWNLPLEEIGSHLIDKLGKEDAEKLVGKENIVKYYGEDAISIWNALLRE